MLEASAADAARAADAIARALCPDGDHAGPCEVPWTMILSRFEDLDDDERRRWAEDFEHDRRMYAAAQSQVDGTSPAGPDG